ncbi:YqgE/AlgH family protein [Mangrovicoccus sp. HB161399]|uniref:YqgE/AlgH family protein n=1 Tax=Mangrovicoccus sp. HB161399 TaxID=2720392 RepID=UPI001554208B|nr:YqgE/AlgH family protein [Mangrovicoccus sp. HB161399]
MDDPEDFDLSGKVLIAMPGMGDPRFEKTVIFLCAHSPDGAMGLIFNKPASDVSFSELLERLEITPVAGAASPAIFVGGPVEHARGFVLHTADYSAENTTLKVDDHFGMTATVDVLEDIARGFGPNSALLALGYSGWGPGQLEDEIAENGWLVCDADDALVFGTDPESKWQAALSRLGVDPFTLSADAGHA